MLEYHAQSFPFLLCFRCCQVHFESSVRPHQVPYFPPAYLSSQIWCWSSPAPGVHETVYCILAPMIEWFVQSKKKEEWRKILYSTWFQVIFCKITITNLRVNQPCCLYAAQFPLLASNGLLHERLVTPPLHHHPYHCTACSWYSQVDCVRLHWYYKWCVSLHGYLGGQTFLAMKYIVDKT